MTLAIAWFLASNILALLCLLGAILGMTWDTETWGFLLIAAVLMTRAPAVCSCDKDDDR